jgi:hypothetical protein
LPLAGLKKASELLTDLIGKQKAQIGKLLPIVARHLGEEAPFLMDHFVV